MALLLLAAPAGASAATPLIIDTDIWSNVDDVAALASAFALQSQGKDQVIAITVNTRTDRPSVAQNSWKCAAAIAQFYDGSPFVVPIGADMPDNGSQVGSPDFITPCAALASASTPQPGTAVNVLRQALANSGGGVTIAEIGYQENLQALLNSPADSISTLDGHALIAAKVSKLVIMGGGYPSYGSGENNLVGNPSAAADVAANWPTPITWSGIEVNVNAGHTIDSFHPVTSPVRAAFDAYAGGGNNAQLFDPAAVYHAVLPNDSVLTESAAGQNVVQSNGANTFTPGTGTQHYLTLNSASSLASSLETLFDVLPAGVQGPPPVPVDLAVPTISGTANQGQTLTESHGSWSNAPTGYSYQWEICDNAGNSCSAIAGATGQTHVLSAADVGATIRVVETASNATGGGSPAASAPTALVTGASSTPPPVALSLPTIAGAAGQGQTLTESHGSWSNSPTGYSYQWQECDSVGNNCFPIAGANGPTHVLTPLDVGHALRVAETASNAAGVGAPAVSAPTSAVAASTPVVPPAAAAGPPGIPAAGLQPVPASSARPSISGSAVQGHLLTESHGRWSSNPTGFSYQWERCNSTGSGCHAIAGATGQSHALGTGDIGSTIRVVEIARNASGGSSPAISSATSAVKSAAANVKLIAAHISSKHHSAQFHFGATAHSSRLDCGLARLPTHKGAKTPSPAYARCGPRKLFMHLAAGSYVLWVKTVGPGVLSTAPTYRFKIAY